MMMMVVGNDNRDIPEAIKSAKKLVDACVCIWIGWKERMIKKLITLYGSAFYSCALFAIAGPPLGHNGHVGGRRPVGS